MRANASKCGILGEKRGHQILAFAWFVSFADAWFDLSIPFTQPHPVHVEHIKRTGSRRRGILTTHPPEFAKSGSIIPTKLNTSPYDITNKGLRISLRMMSIPHRNRSYTGLLDCHVEETLEPIGITLESDPFTKETVFFQRRSYWFHHKFWKLDSSAQI